MTGSRTYLKGAFLAESRSRNGKSPTPLDIQIYTFLSDQGTAPQLSTYEHRLGVAISAASAIISVGATRGPMHGHPRWTLIGPVASRCPDDRFL